MNDPLLKNNGISREKQKSNTGIFVFAALAGILGIIYIVNAGEPDRIDREVKIKAAKLRDAKQYISENYESIIGGDEKAGQPNDFESKPLLDVIKETAQSVGLTNHLSSVSPEENRKLGEVTAKVVLRRIRLVDLVNFLVYVRSKYPGIKDKDGRLRMVPRQNGDSWDAFISLTAKRR